MITLRLQTPRVKLVSEEEDKMASWSLLVETSYRQTFLSLFSVILGVIIKKICPALCKPGVDKLQASEPWESICEPTCKPCKPCKPTCEPCESVQKTKLTKKQNKKQTNKTNLCRLCHLLHSSELEKYKWHVFPWPTIISEIISCRFACGKLSPKKLPSTQAITFGLHVGSHGSHVGLHGSLTHWLALYTHLCKPILLEK